MTTQARSVSPTAVHLLLIVAWATSGAPTVRADARLPLADWTALVPADVRLYVEFRDLSITRHRLQRAGLWQSIRRFGDAAGPGVDEPPWQTRTVELLGMSAEDAITRVLGVRTALAAVDPRRWDRGVVLAELGDEALLPPLLQKWRATPLESVGTVARFRLPTGLLLAQRGPTLLFGPQTDDDSLWSRSVLLLAGRGGPHLADEPDFRALTADLPADSHGLIYVSGPWLEEWRTRPWGASPPVFAATMDAEAEGVAMEVRTRSLVPTTTAPAAAPSAGLSLPADSMIVWSGVLDWSRVLQPLMTSTAPADAEGLTRTLRKAFELLEDFGRRGARSLDRRVTFVVGRLPAAGADDFEQPTLALLLDVEDEVAVSGTIDGLMMLSWTWLTTHWSDSPASEPGDYETSENEGAAVRRLALGRLLAERTRCPFFRRLEVAWTVTDGRLIVATSAQQVDRILAALRGRSPRLSDDKALGARPPPEWQGANWMLVRGRPAAAMLDSWLRFAERREPRVMEAAFWEDWARRRVAARTRLGVGVRDAPGGRAEALVVEVAPDSPAAELIRAGDVILGVSGQPLPASQPARAVAERYHSRSSAAGFPLTIRRGTQEFVINLPVAAPAARLDPHNFDPVSAIRVVAEFLRHTDSMTVWTRTPGPDRTDARVRLRWSPPQAVER